MGSGLLWKTIVTLRTYQHRSVTRGESHRTSNPCRNAAEVSGPELMDSWTESQRKGGLRSDECRFQLGFGGKIVVCDKDKREHPDCFQRKVQKPTSVMEWRRSRAHSMGDDCHMCGGSTDTWVYPRVWGFRDVCRASKPCLFPGNPGLFQQDNARPHT